MVKVHSTTTDRATAWRIRDGLASHPLLGGATAHIDIIVDRDAVILRGWTQDEKLIQLAIRLTIRNAGRHAIYPELETT